MTASPPLRIFLCHCSSDKTEVRQLYAQLAEDGFAPWLDEMALPPGCDWDAEIRRAVQNSDIVLVCLTHECVTKEGYVQKEMRLALDVAETKPDGTVYIIPARLEDCKVPERLAQWQRVDLFAPDGYERLRTSLAQREKQVRSRPASPQRDIPPPIDYSRHGRREYGPWTYALIALISFLCGLAVIALLLQYAEKLTALGLTGNIFYVVLIPLGLCAAAFLFGVLRSYASFRGEQFGGVVNLGGPIVAAALVVAGGFLLVPNPLPFSVTCYVHGPGGPQDVVLRNSGKVLLDLDGDRREVLIGENGQAIFPGVPANFRGQAVPASVEAAGYELAGANTYKLNSGSLYLGVRKKSGTVTGRVVNSRGGPIQGAEVNIAGQALSAKTRNTGEFELRIPGEKMAPEFELTVTADGYKMAQATAYAGSNLIEIALSKKTEPPR